MYTFIEKPVGLSGVVTYVDDICAKPDPFIYSGMRPDSLIVNLDAGEGRTTVTEYIAYSYRNSRIIEFNGGLDDYIEVNLDGTLQQLRSFFVDVDEAAVYGNHYSGVIAIGISGIASHINETQCTEFIDKMKDICNHATVIFFVSSNITNQEQRLIVKLTDAVSNITMIDLSGYTKDEYAQIIKREVEERGIIFEDEKLAISAISKGVNHTKVSTTKEAIKFADSLTLMADYSSFTPRITAEQLRELLIKFEESDKYEQK